MSSIRGKLLVWLWVLLSVIVFTIACWNIYSTRQQLLQFFDTQLIQTNLSLISQYQQLQNNHANTIEPLLDNLVKHHPALTKDYPQNLPEFFLTYQLPQVFQIWDDHKKIILYKSNLAPTTPLLISNQDWQVYTTTPADNHLIYIVAEPREMRNLIIKHIVFTQIWPMLCLWGILLFLLWLVVRWCVKPLERISDAVAIRQPDYLEPIHEINVPKEIQPLVAQINYLFARLSSAFAREKRFTADAAHELRTPLAGLKIQAQVALEADEHHRQKALNNIILSVDRCSHLIQQLSILAQIKPNEPLNDVVEVDLAELSREVIAELSPYFTKKSIEVEFLTTVEKPKVKGNRIALSIMLRNIMDNAIRYSGKHTHITVSIALAPQHLVLSVQDQGPGIPAHLQERIFEQFCRGENTNEMGSGLGLAIVQQIALLHKATIQLSIPQNQQQGLCFAVNFLYR